MKIEGLMTRDVVTVTADESLKEVAFLLSSRHISGLPVCSPEGEVVGVVSEADVIRTQTGAAPQNGGRFGRRRRRRNGEVDAIRTAGDAMTHPALTVRPGQDVSDAAALMIRHGVNRLPVVAGGRLVGIVSRADLVRAFQRSDAEIEREIREDVLRRTLWLAPETMELAVHEGVVSLRGTVETRPDAETAEAFVRRVPGVVAVRCELRWRLDQPAAADPFPLSPR